MSMKRRVHSDDIFAKFSIANISPDYMNKRINSHLDI